MNAEILTIGDEILIGQIINTNAVWIAQQLNQIGIKVVHMASVADDEAAIINAFNSALLRAEFVFITGGLGPTKDDITKKTMAKYFNVQLVLNEDVLNDVSSFFLKRGKELSTLNRNQALVPAGSLVIRNPNGTAPGMWLQKHNTVFISMPGVPFEMKALMTDFILPKIKSDYPLPYIFHKTVLTQGIGESALADLIEVWEDNLKNRNIKLAYLPQPGIVRLRLSTYGPDLIELQSNIETEIESLKKIISKYIYGYEIYGEETPSLEKIVSDLLHQRSETISLAESCTGGYLSSLFTSISGASNIFKGAIVPYTNEAKHQLLQVDDNIFNDFGAVSKECVESLAKNVIKKFNSGYGIAISGIAGPTGGTDEKPVGTVWIAVATNDNCVSKKFIFGDNRQRNITMTSIAALNMLRKFILKEEY
jgi:nicotinamide-nucleotide amidase